MGLPFVVSAMDVSLSLSPRIPLKSVRDSSWSTKRYLATAGRKLLHSHHTVHVMFVALSRTNVCFFSIIPRLTTKWNFTFGNDVIFFKEIFQHFEYSCFLRSLALCRAMALAERQKSRAVAGRAVRWLGVSDFRVGVGWSWLNCSDSVGRIGWL